MFQASGLAEKLSAAFAHSRNREFDFEIAKLNSRDKTRTAEAAALEAKRKADLAAEKARRDKFGTALKNAEGQREDQIKNAPTQPSSDNLTPDELDRYTKEDGSVNTDAVGLNRRLIGLKKTATNNANTSQLEYIEKIQQMLADGTITPEDLNRTGARSGGDNATINENLNNNVRYHQRVPNANVAKSQADIREGLRTIKDLTPEDRTAAVTLHKDLNQGLPPADFGPQDLVGQVEFLQELQLARQTLKKPAGDLFSEALGVPLSAGEKNIINTQMLQVQEALIDEFPDTGDPAGDQENAADRAIATVRAYKEIAGIMADKKVSIYGQIKAYIPLFVGAL